MATQRLERMLTDTQLAETIDTQQGRKKQRLKAAHKRLLAVLQQGKVLVRMCRLIGLYRLRELSHNRVKGMLLVEPMGKHMHADT